MFLAIDGDDIGRAVERLIVLATADEVAAFSQAVDAALDDITQRIEERGALVILRGGDSLLAEMPEIRPEEIEQLLAGASGTLTFSAGTGGTMRNAFLALKLAKASGKRRCVEWSHADGAARD